MRPLMLIVSCSLACVTLTACGKTTAGVSTEQIELSVCQDWKPQPWHSKDHEITIAAAKGNNVRRKTWCDPSTKTIGT